MIEALSVRKDIAQRISQIDVRDAHDAVVLLQDDPALLHIGEDKFLERVQSYVDLAPALRQSVPEIDYVDLRFDERAVRAPGAGEEVGRARPGERYGRACDSRERTCGS